MKQSLYIYVLIVCFSINGCQTNTSLEEQIEGEWIYTDDRECPDIIFFHKDGRYFIWNECGSFLNRLIPIAEKGNWEIKHKTIVLSNRQFIPHASNFRKYHGDDPILYLNIETISKKKITINFNLEDEHYKETYKKVKRFPNLVHTYSGIGSSIEKLALPPIQVSLLKISYKTLSILDEQEPIELVIKDQNSHEIWKKQLVFTDDVKREEILLADKPKLDDLNELIFNINTQKPGSSWTLKVTIY